MGIGTSKGAFHETEFDLHTQPGVAMDNNEISPNEVMPQEDDIPKTWEAASDLS